mmetsp:Transcript_42752/g.167048  ORF Transcript_42752/g.167048 Transcript_42752/m.167048 type:complete len:216 (-) Transcript_42752:15-662(-)
MCSLHDDWEPNSVLSLDEFSGLLKVCDWTRGSWDNVNVRIDRELSGFRLVSKESKHLRLWSYKRYSIFLACFREARVFRQKTVPRVNCVYVLVLSNFNNVVDVQVRPNGSNTISELIRFITLVPMQGMSVLLRIDANRTHPKLGRRSKDSDSNFTSVATHELLKLALRPCGHRPRRPNPGPPHRGRQYSTTEQLRPQASLPHTQYRSFHLSLECQ